MWTRIQNGIRNHRQGIILILNVDIVMSACEFLNSNIIVFTHAYDASPTYRTSNKDGRTKDLRNHVKNKHPAKYDLVAATNAQTVTRSAARLSAHRLKTVKGKATENRPEDSPWKTKFQDLLTKWLKNDREVGGGLYSAIGDFPIFF